MQRIGRLWAVVWLGAGALAGACSSSDGAKPGGPVAEQDFPAVYAHAYCQSIAGCCNAARIPYDAGCEASVTAAVHTAIATLPTTLSYDEAGAGACVAWLGSRTCSFGATSAGAATRGPCQSVYLGRVPPGGQCTSNGECQNGACDPTAGVCMGGGVVQRLGAGASCSATCTDGVTPCDGLGFPTFPSSACFTNDGVFCASSSGTCTTIPAPGGPCPDGRCASGQYCEPVSGLCRALKPDGAACSGMGECVDQCTSGVCAPFELATPTACKGQIAVLL